MLFTLSACNTNKDALKILTVSEDVLLQADSEKDIKNHKYWAYLDIVTEQGTDILANTLDISKKEAKKHLYKDGYTVYTAFDKQINDALAKSCAQNESQTKVSAVITNTNAQICAIYSTKGDNFATKKAPPCSAFKPLSVYAPALDSGIINWSSRYTDSPYKQIRTSDNTIIDWPVNPNKRYLGTDVFIHEAISRSLNTVAVKCLKDYGVENSINFLQEKFQIPLDTEKQLLQQSGEEEIIGNIALGSLRSGVSAVDMSGYYQIFISGGKYQAPSTILKICDGSGNTIYESQYAPKQVVKPTTADIMNRMLREVVSPSGTGKNAMLENVEVGGKTGTDDDNKNNWFIGITPEYSCAFWHGAYSNNFASQIFSQTMSAVYDGRDSYQKNFKYTSGIKQVVYCTESGGQFHNGCPLINNGFYALDNIPKFCNRH